MSIRNLKLEVVLAAIDKATRPIKAVMTSSNGLSKQLKDTKDKLKDLNKAQGNIQAFRALTRDAKETGEKLAAARQKLKGLTDQMAAAGPPTEAMARKIKSAEIAVEKLALANRKSIDAAKAAKAALESGGISAARLGQHETELAAKINATSAALERQQARLAKLSEVQNKQRQARSRYEQSLETRDRIAGAGAGMMAAGATAGAAVTLPIRAYTQAEDAAMQLRVSMMEKGGKVKQEFADINALAERLGNKLPGTTAELQDMMTMLNRQGMSAKAILNGVGEASAYLGVQLKLPYMQAAEYAAKMQDATGALETDMMGVMDTIQRTYQVGVDPSNMVAGFAKLSPVLDMIKQKGLAGAKTMAPLLAMADQASLVGESAGNAYRKVFQRSMDAKKITKGNKLVKDAGIKVDFTNGKGEFGGLDKMFNQLAKLKKLNTQQRNAFIAEIWGDDAETLQALNVMIDKGQSGYREMQQKMAAQASLQERVNAQLGTLKNLWDAATGTFTNAMVVFGEAISPELKALTEWITNIAEKVGTWAKENPALANTLMKIAGITAIALTALGGLAIGLAGIFGPIIAAKFLLTRFSIQLGSGVGLLGKIGTALRMAGGAMMWLGRVFLMNPIGLIITAIAAGAFLLWQNWDVIGPRFFAMWASIKGAFTQGWEWIKTTTSSAMAWFSALPERFRTMGAQIMQGLVQGIASGLGAVKDSITSAGGATIAWFKEKLGIHSPSRVFAELGGWTMEGLAQGLGKGSRSPLATLGSFAQNLISQAKAIALPTPAARIRPQDEDRATARARVLAEPPPLLERIKSMLPAMPAPAANGGMGFDTLRDVISKVGALAAGVSLGAASGISTAAPVVQYQPLARQAPAAMAVPDSVTFQIYQQPGQSVEQLAREIERILDARDRKKASALRGRLSDRD